MPVIAIDLGSTVCKAAVLDGQRILGYASRRHDYSCPEDGWAEQDPLQSWNLVNDSAREAVVASKAGDSIQAVCLSVQGDAVIPVDAAGDPLHPAILGMDTRSNQEAADFEERFGRGPLYSNTGMPCEPLNFATKVLWFQRNLPNLHERVWKYLSFHDFLAFHLARVPALDFSMASRTMMFDPVSKDWIPALLDFAGIDTGHVGNVTRSGVPVGILRARVVEGWGIRRNALLIAGGHNQCMAAIGSGVIEPHLACYSIGTAEVIGACVASPQTSPSLLEGNFPRYCHAADNQYFTITLNQSGGLAMEWLERSILKLGATSINLPQTLGEGIRVWPSPVLFVPHLVGSGTPWCDPLSRAAFVGMSLKTDRRDLLQAVVDAQAFAARLNLDALARSGIELTDVRAVDRGARMWKALRVKATVLQRAIHTLRSPEAALMGAGMLAQTAIGVFPNLEAARQECVSVANTVEPDAGAKQAYDEAYGRFCALGGALRNFYQHWGGDKIQARTSGGLMAAVSPLS